MNSSVNSRPQWKTNQPVESSLTELRMAVDQLWSIMINSESKIDRVDGLLNENVTQSRLIARIKAINGHSSGMPDNKGENSDHDARYVTKGRLPFISGIRRLNLKPAIELTIASGEVTILQSNHTIDTESDDSTDDLELINGGFAGDILILSANHTDRTVVLKHGTGNIYCNSGSDFSLDSTEKMAILIFNGTNWILIS
jgi:hypothetical protein